MPAALTDVIDALAGIKPGSARDAVRNRRPQAREQAEASFRALFEPESFAGVSATERFALAVFVANPSSKVRKIPFTGNFIDSRLRGA